MFRMVLAIMSASLITSAHAEPSSTEDAMNRYFDGEKRGGLVLGAMGIAGLGTGAALVLAANSGSNAGDVARGAGYAIGAVGLVHIAAGVFVYASSASRITAFERAIRSDEPGFVRDESSRMVGVSRQLAILKIVEVALIAGGGGAAVYGFSTDRHLVAGIGLGIAGQAAATLVFDVFAARRASRYRTRLRPTVLMPQSGAAVIPGVSLNF